MLNVNVIRTWAYERSCDVIILSHFWLHTVERNICFGYFVLALNLKIIRTLIKTYVPGPTAGLILVVCIFYPLNTNAIKFIIIEFINTTDKVIKCV